MSEPWKGTKRQRQALREKYNGRCAYCGELLDKMHADHRDPVTRLVPSPWNDLEKTEFYHPERNVVENMEPACAPCNLHKGGYTLEQWRVYIQRSAEIVRRLTSTFRAGERFGVIHCNEEPVVFYFEQLAAPSPPPRKERAACLCPQEIVDRVNRGGTCGMGGCPYGGDV